MRRLPLDETPYISVITLAELQHGLRRAKTPTQQLQRSIFLNEVIQVLSIIPVDQQIALRVGLLDAEMALSGERVDLADLIIAATAIELGLHLVTCNLRHFEHIPELLIAKI
jgi:predicted nucleic acid-binding protein